MKRTLNRILSALLALVLCVGLFMAGATPVSAAQSSGVCGKDLQWTLENGVLTISGTGAMDDYNDLYLPPWNDSAQLVQRIVISPGVTSVGKRAFYGMTNLKTVTLPDTVKTIGVLAFADCIRLAQITIPGVETLGWGSFYGCSSLVNITLPNTLCTIGDQAFYQCAKLSGITIPESVEKMGIMVFSYCKNLVYANVKARLNVLPNWTFYGCVLLWEVYLPSSIEVVETNAFGECPSLYYVDFGGSKEAREEIEEQLSQPTTMEPDDNSATDVTYKETENATITTTTGPQGEENGESGNSNSGTVIDATVTSPEGWTDVVDSVNSSLNTGGNPDVVVQVQENLTMGEGTLSDLTGEDVTVTVQTSDNVSWEIIMQDQTAESLSGTQDFSVSIGRNPADAFPDILGGLTSYAITLGYTSLYTTVQFPMGREVARQIATLYRVDGESLEKLASVVIDDDGMAAFCLAGTKAGAYVIALNVPGISQDEIIIPKSLMGEYGIDPNDPTLMDSAGNKYIITGVTNELGFGIGTMTLIIIGVLVGSALLIGVVMTMWNKQRKKAAAMYADRPGRLVSHGSGTASKSGKASGSEEKTEDSAGKAAEHKKKTVGAKEKLTALKKKETGVNEKPAEEKKKTASVEEQPAEPKKKAEKSAENEETFGALEEKSRRRKSESTSNGRLLSMRKKRENL